MEQPQQPYVIRYEFALSDGARQDFVLQLDPDTFANLAPLPANPPSWAKLNFHRCGKCPLPSSPSALCPTAVRLAEPVERFASTFSFVDATIRVALPEREMVRRATVQEGLSSLIGIFMSTSGCPILGKLRPMARFHLPFASPTETIFRAASMYLLAQYFRQLDGGQPDWSLGGLADLYKDIGEVNRAFAGRLRAATPTDASVNALVLLDVFTKTTPGFIGDKLGDLRGLFEAWR